MKPYAEKYAEQGRAHAKAAKKRAAAKRAETVAEKKKEAEAPLPPWLTGDKRGLPMRPPGKGEP